MGFRRKIDHLEPTKVPTDFEIAWSAGLYEGEGHIQNYNTSHRATARITQKDPEILYWMRDWFGGNVVKQGSCMVWIACGDRARYFLALIYPYLSSRRKAQIDASYALLYLKGNDPSTLTKAQIVSLLDSKPTRSRKGTVPLSHDEAVSRRAEGARRYWAQPENLERRRRQFALRKQKSMLEMRTFESVSDEGMVN